MSIMLSIIIITKNEEKMLPRLLESIKEQGYKEYEVIVSDSNSADNTREIAKKYGCKIVEGGLPSIGRNNGAKSAKGDILLFLDADVLLPKNFLDKNTEEFNRKKLVAATTIYLPLSAKFLDKLLFHFYNMLARILQYISPHAAGFCIFCRKDIFIKIGGFDEKIRFAEDHNLVSKSIRYGKFRLLKGAPLYCDVRRLEKEGRLRTIIKYLVAGLHRFIKGEIYDPPFSYDMQGVNMKKENKNSKNSI